jgi:2-dehydropantoate 2-reductase
VRFVVLGAGAIGGVVGARLHQAGFEVTLIARGPHGDAIAAGGLTIEDPDATAVLAIDVAAAPGEVRLAGDDVVLLATKGHDSMAALRDLHATAGPELPIVCMQNGVENERLALRLFANVYGAVVMLPAAHLQPGVVQAYGAKLTGIIDIGCYPHGVDDRCQAIAAALRRSRLESTARPDIMRYKHAKLVMNLANAVEAMCRPGPAAEQLIERAQAEGREVLHAAGIEFVAEDVDDVRGRWERYGVREIDGRPRAGSSTRQSLARAIGSVESDYLNGEIVLLGRLHGVTTPVNELLRHSIDAVAREHAEPGSVSAQELLAALPSIT